MLSSSQLQSRSGSDRSTEPNHVEGAALYAMETSMDTSAASSIRVADGAGDGAAFGAAHSAANGLANGVAQAFGDLSSITSSIDPEVVARMVSTNSTEGTVERPAGLGRADVVYNGSLGPVEEFSSFRASELFSVSVVVATYNRLAGLQSLLVDLCAQNCEPGSFEVVVVDDESKIPVTAAVANEALATQPYGTLPFGLRLFRRSNGGPGVARDSGIDQASGQIVVILDDDMHIDPGFISAHRECHRRGATVVFGNIQTPRDASLALFERFHMGTIDKFVAAVGRGEPVVEGSRLCTGNVSFRRAAYQRVGGFDTNLRRCEDRDLGIRFELAGEHIVFGAAAVSHHQSDHTDVATWRKRNRLYGELDTVIASKHTALPKVSPWAFLSQLPRAATPVGLLSAAFPALGKLGGSVAYRIADRLDRRAKSNLALRLAGLSYGLDYYAGVGAAFGSPGGLLRVLRSYRAFRRLAAATAQAAQPIASTSAFENSRALR
jgi:glycosyltransferase involved in cell wall biosynthesis